MDVCTCMCMDSCVYCKCMWKEKERKVIQKEKKMLWTMKKMWSHKDNFGGFVKFGEVPKFGTEDKTGK